MNAVFTTKLLASLLLVCSQVGVIGLAQDRLTFNGRFDEGLADWNNSTLSVQVNARRYEGGFRPGRLYDGTLTTFYAHVSGSQEGYFGQVRPLPATSQQQLLNCHAYKRASTGDGDGGFAVIAVSYYDQDWNEVHHVQIPIEGIDNSLPILGEGDGTNFYTAGIAPPEDATWVFLFVYTSEGTDIILDSFELIDYSIVPSDTPITSGLVLNPEFRIGNLGLNSPQSYGNEFWFASRDPSKDTYFDMRSFGTIAQDEFAYQFVPLNDQTIYVLETSGSGSADSSASVGLDFYDAGWNPIGKTIVNYRGKGRLSELRRIRPPQGTAFTSVWVYGAQTSGGSAMSLSKVDIRPMASADDSSTKAIMSATSLVFLKAGPIRRQMSVYLHDRNGVDLNSIRAESFSAPFFRSKFSHSSFCNRQGCV